jgi:hypothetical protein
MANELVSNYDTMLQSEERLFILAKAPYFNQ